MSDADHELDEAPAGAPLEEVPMDRAMIDVLQARCSELLEEKRANDQPAMVRHFHRVADQLVGFSPAIPDEATVRLRLRLITEEFLEMLDACFAGSIQRQLIQSTSHRLAQCIGVGPLNVDFERLVDAWADLKYVIVGSEVSFGVDGNAVFRVVHESNMQKFELPGAGRRADGKITKPPGWKAPDIAGELERQRREEAKRI